MRTAKSPASFHTHKLCGQCGDLGIRSGPSEYHDMKSERAGIRAQATALGPHAVPWGLPQTNLTEPLMVRGSGTQMLLKNQNVPKGLGQGEVCSDCPICQPCGCQDLHPGLLLESVSLRPTVGQEKMPQSRELSRCLLQNLLGYGGECVEGRALGELLDEVSALLQAPRELGVQGHRA